MDNILLLSSIFGPFKKIKQFLFLNFEIEDIDEAIYFISIKIHKGISLELLSQRTYISIVLNLGQRKMFSRVVLIIKDDNFNKPQYPTIEIKRENKIHNPCICY